MSDQLLSYFERELASIRGALSSYSGEFPEHAAAMRLNQNEQEDPNINRLIDAVALLNAKTEKRLDEQFPEVLQDLFNVLYPGYLQVVPSYAPFMLVVEKEAVTNRLRLAKGSEVSVMNGEQESVFSLADELVVEPYVIEDICAASAPFNFPVPPEIRRADSVIQLTLCCCDPSVLFSQQDLGSFNFYVRGFESSSRGLVDLLLTNTELMSLVGEDGSQQVVAADRLNTRIADPSFCWLPKYGGHLSGFDLLRDYFAYPDKAAYMRIDDLGQELMQFDCNRVTLNFFVQQLPVEYLSLFGPHVFSLNTVPAINLFGLRGEPMRYDFTKLSMPVVADNNVNNELTVVSVEQVNEVLPTGEVPLSPLYEGGYWSDNLAPQWQCRQYWDEKGRRLTELSVSYAEVADDQEAVFLSLMLKVCNGRLPCLIPVGSEAESLAAVDLPGGLRVIKTPTAPQYPSLDNQLSWRFVAMLNANFAALVQTEEPTRALQDVLRLCCNSVQCQAAYAVKKVSYRHLVAPITIDGQSIFASGTEIVVLVDDELLGSDFSVFAEILNVLFRQYCSFDRFIQVNVERFGSDAAGIRFEKYHGSQLCL